ncbi:DNA cytosine methyltransferase [Lentzea cavernae]|uniref:DNA (cytosine-5-)-methyltransferase n=1 Tax=Lentzea cavernae TaxID=2020703 RepID=A0ABQ3MTV3_9PSEU|nr:DNA cytosine methyltransferase [Lentzea cavernae]GHH62379.1 hypothetical protein GCM10017774_90020 [Lentzea cavernae]
MTSRRDSEPDSAELTVGSLCTGYGGLDLGLLAALGGGRVVWVADSDPHVGRILSARVPGVPNLGDVRAIDWATVEPVDVVTAGFPCQDISAAGRRAGIEKGERSGIWSDIVAGVRVLRPALVVVENVAALRWRNGGLHRVLGDLAEAGYDALWRSVRASEVGCAHRRERVFLLAWLRGHSGNVRNSDRSRRQFERCQRGQQAGWSVVAGPTEVVANTYGSGLTVSGNSDGPQVRPADSQRLRDAHRLCAATADSDRGKPERWRGDEQVAAASGTSSPEEDQRQRHGHAIADRGEVALDADRIRCEMLRPSNPRGKSIPAGPMPAVPRRRLAAVPAEMQPAVLQSSSSNVDWGEYTAAVRRWEHLLGRAAPYPTQPSKSGRPVLAPAFVEHLMGLPEGWISDLPLPRTAQLRALGNGVVPAQAAYAVSLLLDDFRALLIGEHSADESEAAA